MSALSVETPKVQNTDQSIGLCSSLIQMRSGLLFGSLLVSFLLSSCLIGFCSVCGEMLEIRNLPCFRCLPDCVTTFPSLVM